MRRSLRLSLLALLLCLAVAGPALALSSICGEDVQTGDIVVFFYDEDTGEIFGVIRCSGEFCSCE